MNLIKCLFYLFYFHCFINEHNDYAPKRPRFKLKDRPNNNIPKNLDTINIYKLHYQYFQRKEIFPFDEYNGNYKKTLIL